MPGRAQSSGPDLHWTMRLGLCSWSLQPASPRDLAEKVRRVGVTCVQLSLDPIRTGVWRLDETREALGEAGIDIVSGMMAMAGEDYSTLESIRRTGGVAPDHTWPANLDAAHRLADIAAELRLPLVTFHAGFIPHDHDDPRRGVILDRLGQLVDVFAAAGARAALETGQETASTLVEALADLDRRDVGVNFDPANMILYGMGNPVEALRQLAPRVAQIHIKDAIATKTPGKWGMEVRAGAGDVNWTDCFRVLREKAIDSSLMIEREAGEDRIADMIAALKLVEKSW